MSFGNSAPTVPGYSRSADLDSYLKQMKGMLPTGPSNDQYLTKAGDYATNILSSGYSAYTPEQLNQLYSSVKSNILDEAANQEKNVAARLAVSGLSGGGTARKSLENQSYNTQRLLNNAYNNVLNQNIAATQSAKSQAFSMLPTLSNLYTTNQTAYLQPWLQYGNILGNESSTANSINQQAAATNAQQRAQQQAGLGSFLGTLGSIALAPVTGGGSLIGKILGF